MMEDPVDWCKYIADIEKDPQAIAPQITVRQYLELRHHTKMCKQCIESMDRTLEKDSGDDLTNIMGKN